jgi:citrate synthase
LSNMSTPSHDTVPANLLADWWSTGIIDIKPGSIHTRGYAIEDLIGTISFPSMIWLMTRGELPTPSQSKLLEAALVSGVDHGPHAPSIAIARMASTCGIGINGAMASAINVLGDVHGGAGQACLELYQRIDARIKTGQCLNDAARAEIQVLLDAKSFIPGFGHRFHPIDPRSGRLLELIDIASEQGHVQGHYANIGRAVESTLSALKGKALPMNIDGATAAVYGELGFEPPLARGLFILSRSVGILSHAWEQMNMNGRIKGPMPPSVPYRYVGPNPRAVSGDQDA